MDTAKYRARPKRKQRSISAKCEVSLSDLDRLEGGEWVPPSALVSYARQFASHAGLLCNELRAAIDLGEAGTSELAMDVTSHVVGAWRIIELMEGSIVNETAGLWELPPIWKIDQKLHEKRKSLLKLWLPEGEFVKGGDYYSFTGNDTKADTSSVIVRVAPNDAWHFDGNGRNDYGSGLVSLRARIEDRPAHQVATHLASLAGIRRGGQ